MTHEVPRQITDALRSLGLELGPPLRVGAEELAEACCLACGARVWVLNSATPPVPFDVRRDEDLEPMLLVHGCFFEEGDDDPFPYGDDSF